MDFQMWPGNLNQFEALNFSLKADNKSSMSIPTSPSSWSQACKNQSHKKSLRQWILKQFRGTRLAESTVKTLTYMLPRRKQVS